MAIHENTRELAGKLRTGLKIDTATGAVVVENSQEVYASCLPEGVTPEKLKEVDEVDARFLAASILAVGEAATEAAKADPAMPNRITAELGTYGKNKVSVVYDRTSEVRYPVTDEAGVTTTETKTQHGRTSVSYDRYAGGKRGEVKAAMEEIKSAAAAAFDAGN